MPRLEERIELQLLEKFKANMKSDLERKEVEAAYYQRKDNLAKLPEEEEPGEPEPKKPRLFIMRDEYNNVIQTIHGDGIKHHTYMDIGRYTVFPEHMKQRMFPSKLYGRYEEDEYSINETLGIQTREAGLRITNDLARLTLPKDRKIDYTLISAMDNSQIKSEILHDEKNYVAIY